MDGERFAKHALEEALHRLDIEVRLPINLTGWGIHVAQAQVVTPGGSVWIPGGREVDLPTGEHWIAKRNSSSRFLGASDLLVP